MTTASHRLQVNVYGIDGKKTDKKVGLPDVFKAPIRTDVVEMTHVLLRLNTRQPYAVSAKAGHQTSAESWGTGRAVARIPRVRGGGTHRSGQAAYGNMCRGGRMFAPTHPWRKWHHPINLKQRRHANASAIAATAIPALVEARGHAIDKMPEFPMVLSNEIEGVTKTKEAVQLLKNIKAFEDVEKAVASRRLRNTKGKMRNRRWIMKRGPLVIFKHDNGIARAFRGIPGVTLMSTSSLDLKKLAPGGHVGRLVIWSQDAFEELDKLFGTYKATDNNLPVSQMTVSDLRAIVKNLVARHAVRQPIYIQKQAVKRPNPFKHRSQMLKLNPAYKKIRNEIPKKGTKLPKKKARIAATKAALAKDPKQATAAKVVAKAKVAKPAAKAAKSK